MTKEDAIEVLKRNYPSVCYSELCAAVDMAIKALSATETNETQTLSYTLLCQLWDEIKELEENAIDDFIINGRSFYESKSAILRTTTKIKYLIENKLFILWKEINKNDRK